MCGLAGGFVSAKAGQMLAGDGSSNRPKPVKPLKPLETMKPIDVEETLTAQPTTPTTPKGPSNTGLQIGGY